MENVKPSNINEYQEQIELNLKAMRQVKEHYDRAAKLIDLILKDTTTNENIRNN
jgi:hypothetical protein